ncbi:MAG: N-6 DNA methylase [Flavobacteriaceae bacterium]|nr:N-6 DNA methylase [Flavobacteriaceae bacterium]
MVGFIETKPIGNRDLYGKNENKNQLDRYKDALPNLIVTDYIKFLWYKQGNFVQEIEIGYVQDDEIIKLSTSFNELSELFNSFRSFFNYPLISSVENLADILAKQARLLAISVNKVLDQDGSTNIGCKSQIHYDYETFRQKLLSNIDKKDFIDAYSQMITYGLLTAKLYHTSKEKFTRISASEFIPKSIPFLRSIFQHITGVNVDERIVWVVDNLVSILSNCNISEIVDKAYQNSDPILHFYEPFLKKYNVKQKRGRGVWYTPTEVVCFIIKSVDYLLTSEFNIDDGLADSKRIKKTEDYRVQILDPAVGSGTFLVEAIKLIHRKITSSEGIGVWSSYCNDDDKLLSRLYGFEVLPASYTIAHLKINLLLDDLSEKSTNKRVNIFLTDSLEKTLPYDTLIASKSITNEVNLASKVKNNKSIMCVIGNPPYNKQSKNKGQWITELIESYKYIGSNKLKIKKNWLGNDYVKFIRMGQDLIKNNQQAILTYINDNGYLSNLSFNGMRWQLLNNFEKIFILNLHGESNKDKISKKDENIFDIKTGVCINMFIKNQKNNLSRKLAKVYYKEIKGKRKEKMSYLSSSSFKNISWGDPIEIRPNDYFFVPIDYSNKEEYDKGFCITELFEDYKSGVVTGNDKVLIRYTEENAKSLKNQINTIEREDFFTKYQINLERFRDSGNWTYEGAKKDINKVKIQDIAYNPFDKRYILYYKEKGIVARPMHDIMKNMININDNLALVFSNKQFDGIRGFSEIFVSNTIVSQTIFKGAGGTPHIAPLYVLKSNDKIEKDQNIKQSNINKIIGEKIADLLGFSYHEASQENLNKSKEVITPKHLFYYIYSILHSRKYRKKYGEELKSRFPRIPYPNKIDVFQSLVGFGFKLVNTHLQVNMDRSEVLFPVKGDDIISNSFHKNENSVKNANDKHLEIWINSTQYFTNVPKEVWSFQIGGYIPAQEYLKKRISKKLTYEELSHYGKIIKSISDSIEIMNQIDNVYIP